MKVRGNYIFVSDRLGFRTWLDRDLEPLAAMNADRRVMAFFPSPKTREQTADFMTRMQIQFVEYGYTYFAVDRLADDEFIGFIGLSRQTYAASFTPCIDLGWRLRPSAWQQGFATEGARRCLGFAFHTLTLPEVYSVAPKINRKSEQVMKKLGMKKIMEFEHPLLLQHKELNPCVVYLKTAENGPGTNC